MNIVGLLVTVTQVKEEIKHKPILQTYTGTNEPSESIITMLTDTFDHLYTMTP